MPPLPPGEKGSSSSKVRELYLVDAWVGSDPFRLSQKSESKKDVENQLAKAVKDRFVPSSLCKELVKAYHIPAPRLLWKRSMGLSRRLSRTSYSPVGQDRYLRSRLRPSRRPSKWPLVSRVDAVDFPVTVIYMIHQLVFINKTKIWAHSCVPLFGLSHVRDTSTTTDANTSTKPYSLIVLYSAQTPDLYKVSR